MKLFFFILMTVSMTYGLTTVAFFTPSDKTRFHKLFDASLIKDDVASIYHYVLGMKHLDLAIPSESDKCSALKKHVKSADLASVFHAFSASSFLKNCKLSISDAKQTALGFLNDKSKSEHLYYAVTILKTLGEKIDTPNVRKFLLAALKRDDAPLSFAYGFRVATLLDKDGTQFFENIEDAVGQADEIDKKYYQFEGGLYVTSMVISSIFQFSDKLKKPPEIADDKVVGFANFFLTRTHAHKMRDAAYMMEAVHWLTANKYAVPVAIVRTSHFAISGKNPKLKVQVSDLLGKPVGKLTVVADSAKNLGTQAVVLSKQELIATSVDGLSYELDFLASSPSRGFYRVLVSLQPPAKMTHLVGLKGAEIELKVSSRVSLSEVKFGAVDRDAASSVGLSTIAYPSKHRAPMEADYHQRLVMKFKLLDEKSQQAIEAHQVFTILTHMETKAEIIFIAEQNSGDEYKLDVDLFNKGKDFAFASGVYSVQLVIGDAGIDNPIDWNLAEIKLTFSKETDQPKADFTYKKRPEIEHKFREPDKRPPSVISLAFTGIVLLPFFIMFGLWVKLGVNISNFPLSLSAVGFHVCLGLIFGLYYWYWAALNMFQTLRYLGLLAIPTFIFGNRMLSAIAASKK